MVIFKIKKRVDRELERYFSSAPARAVLEKLPAGISRAVTSFVMRDGKRIRPVLFILSYLGFCKKEANGLFRSAISLELFHNFALIHDDIIDRSDIRRGHPSMHAALGKHIGSEKSGEDLALVVGDMLYSMGIEALLAIDEKFDRKERVLKDLTAAACDTGAGQASELLLQKSKLGTISKDEILQIYSYKTARYTFSFPLATGARLAGASEREIKKLFSAGLLLGTAFQIKNDLLDILPRATNHEMRDLRDAKKTTLIWYAHKNSSPSSRSEIEIFLSRKKRSNAEIEKIRSIIISSGAIEASKEDVEKLCGKALAILKTSGMKKGLLDEIENYSKELLDVKD